jgi:hypothetical protein
LSEATSLDQAISSAGLHLQCGAVWKGRTDKAN